MVGCFLLVAVMSLAPLALGISQYAYAADDTAAEPEITEAQSAILEDDQETFFEQKIPIARWAWLPLPKL